MKSGLHLDKRNFSNIHQVPKKMKETFIDAHFVLQPFARTCIWKVDGQFATAGTAFRLRIKPFLRG
ncbi:MAG: hypothetical protein HYV28_04540 [Ignavibacteriales bacterium]|nr:hypothetical protein [Ignavibacteriales bacterium]